MESIGMFFAGIVATVIVGMLGRILYVYVKGFYRHDDIYDIVKKVQDYTNYESYTKKLWEHERDIFEIKRLLKIEK